MLDFLHNDATSATDANSLLLSQHATLNQWDKNIIFTKLTVHACWHVFPLLPLFHENTVHRRPNFNAIRLLGISSTIFYQKFLTFSFSLPTNIIRKLWCLGVPYRTAWITFVSGKKSRRSSFIYVYERVSIPLCSVFLCFAEENTWCPVPFRLRGCSCPSYVSFGFFVVTDIALVVKLLKLTTLINGNPVFN